MSELVYRQSLSLIGTTLEKLEPPEIRHYWSTGLKFNKQNIPKHAEKYDLSMYGPYSMVSWGFQIRESRKLQLAPKKPPKVSTIEVFKKYSYLLQASWTYCPYVLVPYIVLILQKCSKK